MPKQDRDLPNVPVGTSSARWAAAWAAHLGAAPESAEYLARVQAWRALWRPERVRVLIVAESHLVERPGDLDVQVDLPGWAELTGAPAGYCRMVQCLGWGEPGLTLPHPPGWRDDANSWQYWDLLGACAVLDVSNVDPRRSPGDPVERLRWKLDTMRRVRERGIWLVDASLLALKIPREQRRTARGATYRAMVRDSYERFVWPVVESDEPEQVWVIGRKTTYPALAGRPEVSADRVLWQPRFPRQFRADLERIVKALPRDRGPVAVPPRAAISTMAELVAAPGEGAGAGSSMDETEARRRDAAVRERIEGQVLNRSVEFALVKELVEHRAELLPDYPFLVEHEWEVVAGRSQSGCGDLVFTDGRMRFAVVEVKSIKGAGTPTSRRNKVERQARRYADALRRRFEGADVTAWVYTDDERYAGLRRADGPREPGRVPSSRAGPAR